MTTATLLRSKLNVYDENAPAAAAGRDDRRRGDRASARRSRRALRTLDRRARARRPTPIPPRCSPPTTAP